MHTLYTEGLYSSRCTLTSVSYSVWGHYCFIADLVFYVVLLVSALIFTHYNQSAFTQAKTTFFHILAHILITNVGIPILNIWNSHHCWWTCLIVEVSHQICPQERSWGGFQNVAYAFGETKTFILTGGTGSVSIAWVTFSSSACIATMQVMLR